MTTGPVHDNHQEARLATGLRELRIVHTPRTSRERLEHSRDVFKVALLANADGVIVGHSHPSGDPTPSPEDVALYRRLRAGGDLLGIAVLDFVIIGDGGYRSFQAGRR